MIGISDLEVAGRLLLGALLVDALARFPAVRHVRVHA